MGIIAVACFIFRRVCHSMGYAKNADVLHPKSIHLLKEKMP